MNIQKIILPFLGVAGASGLGVFIQSQISSSPKKTTFRDKYRNAILDLVATSGPDFTKIDSKWSSFKTSGTPKSDLLKESKTLSASKENDSKAKYREGCKRIYDSEFSDSGNLWEDFKNYCSKNNSDAFDGVSGAWVSENINGSVGTDWSARLKALKDSSSNVVVPEKLSKLKAKITTESYDVTQAKELKDWCELEKMNPFEGSQSDVYKSLKSFCRKES
ncbi:hypothetical protein MHC_02495 [Mycoplasma haemocanis str. Illinois]|uniref:Uncharacterized protein n=1 Tax=Mycoplasma haemocanis (strain Illinois) TaxID=1111676 RepID=H6N6U1_MYCHN|nr:hypothetical protein [Mycoplasma haemocanis]AEW45363.1 hypothetical protein MHC_02495 [Mycoplasma haemocanis str. Illinois]